MYDGNRKKINCYMLYIAELVQYIETQDELQQINTLDQLLQLVPSKNMSSWGIHFPALINYINASFSSLLIIEVMGKMVQMLTGKASPLDINSLQFLVALFKKERFNISRYRKIEGTRTRGGHMHKVNDRVQKS